MGDKWQSEMERVDCMEKGSLGKTGKRLVLGVMLAFPTELYSGLTKARLRLLTQVWT